MKISELKRKENFSDVFAHSVERFFLRKFNLSLKVRCYSTCNKGDFLQNDNLNLIWHKDLSWRDYIVIVGEYIYTESVTKRMLRRLYICLCFAPIFRIFFNSGSVDFFNLSTKIFSVGFIPGNHSIRVIDFNQDYCWVFGKIGANPLFLKQEIGGRSRSKAYSPKLISVDPHSEWLCEERISGCPVDRVKRNANLTTELDLFLSRAISHICFEQRQEVSYRQYCEDLWDEVSKKLRRRNLNFVGLTKMVRQSLDDDAYAHEKVVIALSHGDMQSGNIFLTDSRFKLIDWEYSHVRSVFYDALVFESNARSIAGFGVRLSYFYREPERLEEMYQWSSWVAAPFLPVYCILFWLEELSLRLMEAESGVTPSSKALTCVLTEAEKFYAEVANF